MMRHRLFRATALGSLALLLLAMGAALRPWLGAPTPPAPVLTAVEAGFVQDMVAHHGQALILVQRLDRGADPAVRALAAQIADNQRTELGMMLGWLRLAGLPVTNPAPMTWMTTGHAHVEPGAVMPGMASTAELDELSAADAATATALFLRLMQRHHHGGIAMAVAADALLDGGEVQRFARDLITEQSREAGLLGLLLARPTPDEG